MIRNLSLLSIATDVHIIYTRSEDVQRSSLFRYQTAVLFEDIEMCLAFEAKQTNCVYVSPGW